MCDWEGLYEVSSAGRVRSVRRKIILKSGDSGHCGHQAVVLSDSPRRVKRYVHHLVLEAFLGPRPPGMVSRHLNGDSSDNSAPNLRWGTHEENYADQRRHGTANMGERNGRAKLTRSDVLSIRRLRSTGYTASGIVDRLELPVHVTTVEAVISGKTWGHVGSLSEDSARG